MQRLRSRAGLAAVTVGAFALLCVPVVALAKGQPQDPGDGQNQAGQRSPEAQAPVPGPRAEPPGQVKNEPPGRAKPAPSGQAKGHARAPGSAGEGPAARAPSQTGGGNAGRGPAGHKRPASHAGTPPGHSHVAPGHAKRGRDEPAEGSSEPPSSSGEVAPSGGSADEPAGGHSGPDSTGAPDLTSADSPAEVGGVAGAVAGETVELPEDASPATLPFTGLQLALLGLIGLATAAGGLLVRQRV